jgi:hypothetical protein
MKTTGYITSKNLKILIIAFFVVVGFVRHKPHVISWDVLAHYMYLPATFIYHDTGIQNHDAIFDKIQQYDLSATFYQVVRHDNGNHILKTTCGWAILHSPFFFGAHLVALAGPAPADGFSAPYQFAMTLSSLLFICIGMIYLRKILRFLFDDRSALITMIALVFGTNLFQAYFSITSAHLMLFGLYAFFLWQTIRWHEDPSFRKAILIGISAAFIALLRPVDAICIILPLIWGVHDLQSFKKKWILLTTHLNHVLLVVAAGVVTILPQLIYWKIYTGSFIFYSYATPGEGMDFFTPYIREVLFSFRKGWFVYTPMMLLAMGGFITLYKHYKNAFYPVLIFTVLNIYLISCWTCWWYAGSFGHRAFIHSYAVLAIPLGSFLFEILKRKRLFTYISLAIISFFILLNLFQTYQYKKRVIDSSRMTRDYYWAVFGKLSEPDDKTRELLMLERSIVSEDYLFDRQKYRMIQTISIDYSQMPEVPAERKGVDSTGRFYVVLDSSYTFTPAFRKSYHYFSHAEHLYFIIRTEINSDYDLKEHPVSLVIHFSHKGGAYKYRAIDSEKMDHVPLKNQWSKMEYLYLSPEIRHSSDEFTVYFWHRGKQPVRVGNIEVEVWEPVRGW